VSTVKLRYNGLG